MASWTLGTTQGRADTLSRDSDRIRHRQDNPVLFAANGLAFTQQGAEGWYGAGAA